MDERSSSDDTSAIRGSLVDSRRLLFEKIVNEQAIRPEAADEAVGVVRLNGRLPRSVRASKVNSLHVELVPSNRVDVRQSIAKNRTEATVVGRRRSLNDDEFPAEEQPGADNERASPVPSPMATANANQSPPSLPTLPSSQTVAPSIAASENSPPSGEIVSQVPLNECHSSVSKLCSSGDASPVLSVLCQSSDDRSPANYSKRISYHHAVLNGAKLKLATTSSPPDTVLEMLCSNSPLSNGNADHPSNASVPHSLRLHDCESPSITAIDTTPKASSPVKNPSASTNDCYGSFSSSSRDTCEPVMIATGNVGPAQIDDNDEPVQVADSDELTETADSNTTNPTADRDKSTRLADNAKATTPAIINSSVSSAAGNKSAQPAVANKPTKPAIRSKPIQPVVKTRPVCSSSPVVAPTIAADYPEELNPFSDDDDDENHKNNNPLETSRVDVGSEHNSTNPFGSDSEDEDINESKSTPASTNPFWSGSEEEENDDDEEHSSPRTPVPLPRRVTKSITSSSPKPSPRPRPRVTTGYSSNEISPASSCHGLSADSTDLSFHPSSNLINSTPRRKRPAPPPPTSQTDVNHSSSKNEHIQNSNNEQMKITESAKINLDDSNVSLTDLKESASKKVVSPWKNKKRPAPARPTPLRRPVKEMPLEDIKVELEDIEIRYQELVRQTTQLEEKIHVKTELESAESSVVEEMVVQLFELVNEKNELFRRRSELVNMRKMHNLEVEQADIEYQIRCLMLRPESNKTDTDKANEEALVKRLVEVVEKRNEIIDLMDKDRLRETVEDESVTTQLEPKTKKDHRSKEKKKKSKKEKSKEPDESDKHTPSKLIKQKFMTLRHTAKKLHPKLPD